MSDDKEAALEKRAALIAKGHSNRAILKANRALADAIDEHGPQILDSSADAIHAALLNTLLDPEASHRDKAQAAKYLDEFLAISQGSATSKAADAIKQIRNELRIVSPSKKLPEGESPKK